MLGERGTIGMSEKAERYRSIELYDRTELITVQCVQVIAGELTGLRGEINSV